MHNVTLNNGVVMPILGFGVFQVPDPLSASRSWPTLYLIHQPLGDYYGAWRVMQELYRDGLIRATIPPPRRWGSLGPEMTPRQTGTAD